MNIKIAKENKGATLVLVIVCMLFVGIIAAAILTLTTGNINSVKTGENSTDNFYSAENVLDDVKAYFQKIANDAATEAYAKMLDEVASKDAVDMKTAYENNYALILKEKLNDELTSATGIVALINGGSFDAIGISLDYKDLEIEIPSDLPDDFVTNSTLKGIKIKFTDDADYTTTIDTDLEFDCNMPPFTWAASDSPYEYNVDKFIIISDGNIKGNTQTSGNITGSLYSGKDINLAIASSSGTTGVVNVKSQYVISKGDVIVDNGIVNFSGMKNDSTGNTSYKYLDLEKKKDKNKLAATIKTQDNATMWVNGIEMKAGKPVLNVDDIDATLYVKDDLSLDADYSQFTMNQGNYYGFSSDDTQSGSVSTHNPSSAIVINGKNSVLDLSGTTTLTLAGTAYTQVPAINGDKTSNQFFVQGESITFKSLQSAYLVPGEYIIMEDTTTGETYKGYNPIPASEISELKAVDTSKVATELHVNFSGNGYKRTSVRYVTDSSSDGEVYYYIFWDFSSVGDAVKYFNGMYNKNKEMLGDKISMIGTGSIKLPTTYYTKGGLIGYTGSSTNVLDYKASNWSGSNDKSDICDTYSGYYDNFVIGLSKKQPEADNLFDNLFSDFNINTLSAASPSYYKLKSPASWDTEKYSLEANVLNDAGSADGIAWDYYLVTGSDIAISSTLPNTKYIVVATGDVTVTASTFHGIIFAKGDVKLGTGVNMYCLGNVSNHIVDKFDPSKSWYQYDSEFDAILNVCVDNDSSLENPNTLLRNIFGVAGYTAVGNAEEASGSANDIASIETVNYKKN